MCVCMYASFATPSPPAAGPSPVPPFPLTTRRSSPPSPPFSATFSEASALVYIYIYIYILFVAKIGFDTAENEPAKIRQAFPISGAPVWRRRHRGGGASAGPPALVPRHE